MLKDNKYPIWVWSLLLVGMTITSALVWSIAGLILSVLSAEVLAAVIGVAYFFVGGWLILKNLPKHLIRQ